LQAVRVFGFLEKPVRHLFHIVCPVLTFATGLPRVGETSTNQAVDRRRQHVPG
jgi:hypothetical protein